LLETFDCNGEGAHLDTVSDLDVISSIPASICFDRNQYLATAGIDCSLVEGKELVDLKESTARIEVANVEWYARVTHPEASHFRPFKKKQHAMAFI
jgi:hypothetical protein